MVVFVAPVVPPVPFAFAYTFNVDAEVLTRAKMRNLPPRELG